MDINEFLKWNRQGGTLDLPSHSSNMGASSAGYTSGFMDNQQVNPSAAAPETGGSWFSDINWMDKVDENGNKIQGAAGLGLGVANNLFNGWLGYQKLGIAKDQLKENKRQFDMNWGAQKTTTNNRILNARRSRIGSREEARNFDKDAYLKERGIQ